MSTSKTNKRILTGLSLIGLISLALTLFLRQTNTFSHAVELPLYDTTTKLTWPWNTGHPDIVIVTIQNADDWPLTDQKLAEVLGTLSSAEPSVIAIDLIRDTYRSGDPLTASVDAEALDTSFAWNGTLLAIDGLSTSSYPGFDAPPYFQRGDPAFQRTKVGLANFPRDEFLGFKIRRGLFSTSDPDRFSLPALAAIHACNTMNLETPPTIEDLDRISAFTADSGGYALNETQIGSQFLIKFGPDMDKLFPEFSMVDVLDMNQETLNQTFSGKIVFFGTGNTDTAKDEIPVIGNPELRGVKLLALTTAQLIRELTEGEAPIQTTGNRTEIILIILTSIISVSLLWFFRLSGVRRFLSLFALTLLTFLATCLLLKQGTWMPVGSPITSILLNGFFGSLFLHREITLNLRNYSSTLKQQFGDQVAHVIEQNREELLEEGTLPKRHFEGTALFCDLLGFTGITEQYARENKSEKLLSWINHYLAAMIPIFRNQRGVIVKFAGDGIFVIFGFPNDPHHADRAVQSCREMEQALRALNQERPEGSPAYYVRSGLYSGPIYAGPVGSRERLSYDFLGSTINKAARFESHEKETYDPHNDSSLPPLRGLISQSTKALLSNPLGLKPFEDSPSQIDKNLASEEDHEQIWEIIF